MRRAAGGDKWDAMPLLVVDFLELRKLLGMAADQKYIAPQDLLQAKIESPKSRQPTTFMNWAQQLVFKPENELSPLEKKGVEIFDRLRAYQDHRAGRRLEILPVLGSAEKHWISLDTLLRTRLDDETDPGGTVRELRYVLQAAGGLSGPFAPRVQRGLARVPGNGPRNGAATRGLSRATHDRSGGGL